jgi:FHA domain
VGEGESRIEVMEKNSGLINGLEFAVRRLFERIGGAIDFAWRRTGQSQSVVRTDLSALVPQIERAVENNLRREGGSIIAPNLIELRYDYETYTRMGGKRREYLQRELSASIYEFIYNRRYKTLRDLQVKISYDAFTRGLEINLGFGEGKKTVIVRSSSGNTDHEDRAENVAKQPAIACELVLRGMGVFPELRAQVSSDAEPLGVGRNVANSLVIKHPTVSNFHAAFVLSPDGSLELADRASSNGTYVNGVLLGTGNKTIVRDGDLVRFGEVELTLEITLQK